MDQRLLLVHAHPDDETIGQGATMAKYVARGTQVTLVTCTLGEEGEVLVPELEHLAADQDDALGEHRITELANAMKELGVTDHRFLGGAGHYRDSGMMWDEQRPRRRRPRRKEGTFWQADLLEAADLLVEIIREVRPQVLVTYDQFGGYGHPDHIQAHRVATYAAALAAVPSYRPELGAAVGHRQDLLGRDVESRGCARACGRCARPATPRPSRAWTPTATLPPFMVPDDQLVARSSTADDYADAKIRAMKAHATQIAVDGPFFALSNNIGNQVWGTEFYRLAKGVHGPDQRATASRPTCSPAWTEPCAVRARRRAAGRAPSSALAAAGGAPVGCSRWACCSRSATTYAVPWWLLRSRQPRTAASYAVGLAGGARAWRWPAGPRATSCWPRTCEGSRCWLAGLGLVVVGDRRVHRRTGPRARRVRP